MTKDLKNYKEGEEAFYNPSGRTSGKGWQNNSKSAIVFNVRKNKNPPEVVLQLTEYKNNKAAEKTKTNKFVTITDPNKIVQFLKGGRATRKSKGKSRSKTRRSKMTRRR